MATKPGCPDPCLGKTCPDTKVVRLSPCVTRIDTYECRVCFVIIAGIIDEEAACGEPRQEWLVWPCSFWQCQKRLTGSEYIRNGTCVDCDPMPFPEEHVPHEGTPVRRRVRSEEQEWFVRNQFKKNHPGCECCKRVLIWDLGYYGTDLRNGANDEGMYVDTYRFQSMETIAVWYEEMGVPVDFVTGGSAQGLGFYTSFNEFDPDTVAVEEEFWTGNIHDYKLIIWPFPTADEDLDQEQLCAPDGDSPNRWLSTPCDQSDHQHLGGLPSWWETVSAGEWSGRVLMHTTSNTIGQTGAQARIGNAVNLFLNTLTDVHGMDIDPDIRTLDTDTLMEIVEEDLMEGVTSLRADTQNVNTIPAVIEGGDDLAIASGTLRTGADWCADGEGEVVEGTWAAMQRKKVFKDNDHIVDFVISSGSLFVPGDSTNRRRFFENLINVPLDND